MVHDFAYLLILGKPLVMWTGLLSFLSLLITATLGFLFFYRFKLVKKLPFLIHPGFSFLTFVLAVLHGLLGLSVYFNF